MLEIGLRGEGVELVAYIESFVELGILDRAGPISKYLSLAMLFFAHKTIFFSLAQ